MCFSKKRSKLADQNNEDRSLIEINYRSIESLIVLSNDQELEASLRKLQEQLKYLSPSTNDKVYGYDKKIKSTIEDLKITLTKDPDSKNNAKVELLLQEIKVLIADRNSIL